jgi:hypothetical protein
VAKQVKTDRQAVIESIRSQQKTSERKRGLAIVGVCAVVAVLIIGLAAYRPIKNAWDLRQFRNVAIDKIGAPASVCAEETTKPATGEQQHIPDGQAIFYPDAPPAFGEHYNTPDPMQRKLYSEGDRPVLGILVHNLEHGYTILWYDETVAGGSSSRPCRGWSPTARRSPRASTSPSPTGRSVEPTRTRPATPRSASGSTARRSPAPP